MDIYNKRILMNKFNKGDIVKHKNVEGERFVIETFDNVGLLVGIRRLRDCRLLWVDPECIIVVMNGTDERIYENKEKNTCNSMSMNIKKVIFNNPATIVFWSDGSKTVVKSNLDDYDPEKGLAMAIAKKALGNEGNYYNVFKKWIPEKHDSNSEQCHMNDKIIRCEIAEGRFVNRILVYYNNGSSNCIGTYYPDELHFSQKDFIGLTEKEAYDLIAETDKKYLRG